MQKYFAIAHMVAQNSLCERDKVGAVIVRDGCVVSVGWNQRVGCGECVRAKKNIPSGLQPEIGCCWHAEAHAIKQARNSGRSVLDSDIYVTRIPCELCRAFMVECGVARFHYEG